MAPKQVALVQDSFAKVALNVEDTSMAGIHSLDRLIGDEYPTFATEADVRAFEQAPYADRIAAQSTYDAIKLGAGRVVRRHRVPEDYRGTAQKQL
jgi:hypothetical protein